MRKKKVYGFLFKYVVKKPIIYILFLVVNIVAISILLNIIKIPVYSEHLVKVMSKTDVVQLELYEDIQLNTETAVILYKDREEYVYKSKKYTIDGNMMKIYDLNIDFEGDAYLNVEADSNSLLQLIIKGSF